MKGFSHSPEGPPPSVPKSVPITPASGTRPHPTTAGSKRNPLGK